MMPNRYGVRIYPIEGSEVIRIKQTVKRPKHPRYVVDTLKDGTHREAHIKVNDAAAIADAVQRALRGNLRSE